MRSVVSVEPMFRAHSVNLLLTLYSSLFYVEHQFGSICCPLLPLLPGDTVPSPSALSTHRRILSHCKDVYVIIVDF